jgi:hypothetical protein
MRLERSNTNSFSNEEVLIWETILESIRQNFILVPTEEDSFIASKPIEGIKTMPHLVILFLLFKFNVPIDLMELHFDLSEKKLNEFKSRLCIGIHKNDTNLLRKIKICETFVAKRL